MHNLSENEVKIAYVQVQRGVRTFMCICIVPGDYMWMHIDMALLLILKDLNFSFDQVSHSTSCTCTSIC